MESVEKDIISKRHICRIIFPVRYDNGRNKVETVDAYSDKCRKYLEILEDPPRVRE